MSTTDGDEISEWMMKSEVLAQRLLSIGDITVAVSGGVDSMTLACFAHRLGGTEKVRVVHAASPAVPADAEPRIRSLAEEENWNLEIVSAGEFDDPSYRANPINRCFYCKSNLYRTLASRGSNRTVVSGTNCDDIADFRPGLEAARNFSVRHPFVEAGFSKQDVRKLAVELDLPEFAVLPASPCLSSRVETGLPIEVKQLALIDAVETLLRERLSPETVRCRVRHHGIVVELDAASFERLGDAERRSLTQRLKADVDGLVAHDVAWAEYRRGSAFVGDRSVAM